MDEVNQQLLGILSLLHQTEKCEFNGSSIYVTTHDDC